ncbi:NAD(P)-binding protein [Penicillium pulvis]|uniref:NAD(P)-binding protein n=1 Tax=Penicillium pulvis TaxID=1562058 RepID=UPI00254801F0|nr:NAD(P)-binding protein [Penicillium pulvis]KAJ5803353.1 NAD(P)-binding protein [Penicillium pulvis]
MDLPVHVMDLGRAYLTLLAYIERSPPAVLLENPYFFAENGSEASMLDVAKHISQVLHEAGKLESPEIQSFAESDYDDVFGPFTERGFGCNSRSRSVRLQALGWKPTEKDIWTSLKEDDAPAILRE